MLKAYRDSLKEKWQMTLPFEKCVNSQIGYQDDSNTHLGQF